MMSRVTAVAALAVLACALYWTLRLECADWLFVKGDTASIRRASDLAPGTAEYSSALAQAEPGLAVAILEDAVKRSPLDGGLRVELGVAAEQRGDFANAEMRLREATLLDRGFGPRWALSDFYFHRHDTERFWPAVRSALAVSYGDVSAQFRQCWALTSDPATILDRAIPDRPVALRQYLDFLLRENRLDAAAPVARRVLTSSGKKSAPALLNYCDRMLDKWRGTEAMAVWKELTARHWIAEAGRGFDWRISTVEGIHIERTARGWRLRFSGRQPESSEILSQYVPLLPHRRYLLTVRIPADSGLQCRLYVSDGRDLLAGADAFQAPDDVDLGRLVVAYRRMPGTVRIEGIVDVEGPLLQEYRQ